VAVHPPVRRVNTAHALYEGTVRGPKVPPASRFVGAAVQRAQLRARQARAAAAAARGAGPLFRGDPAPGHAQRQFGFADENAAPPARGGFELFLEAKRAEWDPEGAKLHPKAVN
jgi:hypothetical protein